MAKRFLLTGATGFVGGALALDLLEQTDGLLWCVVRVRRGETADERLRGALHRAARVYGRPNLFGEIDGRCRGVAGDLMLPELGVAESVDQISEVWHVAASLAFEDDRKDEILEQNVGGTSRAVALSQRLGVPVFNHVSTAYVSDRSTGRIPAAPVDGDGHCLNWYERSKVAGERLVAGAGFDCLRVFRPSVVIGHSETGGVTSYSGLYGFVAALALYRASLRGRFAS